VLYMIISTGIRIITQDLMFRAGVTNPHKGVQRSLPAPETKEEPAIEVKPPSTTKPSTPKPPVVRTQQQTRSRAKRKRKAR
jgi:hypothetical protein